MAKEKTNKALGRGLSSIFGEDVENLIQSIENSGNDKPSTEISIAEIRPNPYQPRKNFDEKALKELAASIEEHGVFTPILIRRAIQGYEIIAGERRWRAAKLAGLSTIPAIIMEFNDEQMMEISILENIQRENLNPIEEAMAYQGLIERLGYTQEVLAKRVGKTREYCANMLRLLKLPQEAQSLVASGKLTTGHVRPLITLEDEGQIYDIACKIIDEKMSVREVEQYIKKLKPKKPSPKKEKDPNLTYVESMMQLKLQTKVTVDNKQIVIRFTSVNDLNRILEILGCIEE